MSYRGMSCRIFKESYVQSQRVCPALSFEHIQKFLIRPMLNRGQWNCFRIYVLSYDLSFDMVACDVAPDRVVSYLGMPCRITRARRQIGLGVPGLTYNLEVKVS